MNKPLETLAQPGSEPVRTRHVEAPDGLICPAAVIFDTAAVAARIAAETAGGASEKEVRAIAVRGGSHAISASARTTAGTQASARATAKTRVRISPRAPRLPVTG